MDEKDSEYLLKMKNVLSDKKKVFSGKKSKSHFKKITPIYKYMLIPTIFCFIIVLLIIVLILHFKLEKKDNIGNIRNIRNIGNISNIILEKQNVSLNITLDQINETKETKETKEEVVYKNISESYKKAQDFLNKAISGTLLDKANYTPSETPKVSAIIPVYNSKNIILRSIRSIQNQNMKNLEIILVNDFSTDGSLTYLQELQKEDARIKIINNQKNMGTLYSRCIGALSAKGKYIFPLDNGDMFLDYDIFDTISDVAEKDNYDIVEFKAINVDGLYDLPKRRLLNIMFSNHPLNLVLKQPELGYFTMQPRNETGQYSIVDNYIWNKCIKTEIYQKGLNLFGEERYKRYMTMNEDLIIVILLFNIADTYKFIGKYGVLNVPNSGGAMKGQVYMNLNEMYVLDCLSAFSKDSKKNKKIVVQYMITLLGRNQLDQTLKDPESKKLFDSLLERIENCQYITQEDKDEINKRAAKFK